MQLIHCGGLFTNLCVTRHLAIGHDNCGGDLRYVRFWIIAILSTFRNFFLSCDLRDFTSHLLAVYSCTLRCVDKFKAKVSLTSHEGSNRGWNICCLPLL